MRNAGLGTLDTPNLSVWRRRAGLEARAGAAAGHVLASVLQPPAQPCATHAHGSPSSTHL